MSEHEYVQEIRRAVRTIISAGRMEPGLHRRVCILSGVIAFLHAHERYTGAQRGTAAILKPLVLTCVDTAAEHGGFLPAFVSAIERKYHIMPSKQERGARV